ENQIVPYVLATICSFTNPVKFIPFSIRFVRIPTDSTPGGSGDLSGRRGVRFSAGSGEIARSRTPPLFQDKMAAARRDFDEQDRRAAKGTEVFVGGLPRSATESTLREVFSPCGEIVDVRIMKDQNGLPKGYAFVRFAKREYANTAKRQKNGMELQGKRLVVDLSMDQDTLFFGNLCKGNLHPW
uniref:RRM domain-containing protein n=1 Tax=Setaria italica TaxID=4555 RepID=K3ZEN8_SETIT